MKLAAFFLVVLGPLAAIAAPVPAVPQATDGTPASSSESSIIGDSVQNPIPVPALPFHSAGTTCDYTHDYDEMCPYGGYQAPDVVYAFSPATDVTVDISLCESSFDTKMYVYENGVTWGMPYACNDDWCVGPNYPYPYLSHLQELPFSAGDTYYVVVDSYGSDCGEYVLRIQESRSCVLTCPPGADEEGEPKCYDGYVDHFNGGCGSDPPVFQPVDAGPDVITICAFSGSAGSPPSRDEDWYEVTPPDTSTLRFCCRTDFPALMTLLDGNQGCLEGTVLDYVTTETCESACLTRTVAGGTYWLRIHPLYGGILDCSSKYVLTVQGYDGAVTAVSPAGRPPSCSGIQGTFPNPFVESTTIRCALAAPGAVWVRIVDVTGRLVRILVNGRKPDGEYHVAWDGRDDAGVRVAGGIYFVTLETGAVTQTRKVVFLAGE